MPQHNKKRAQQPGPDRGQRPNRNRSDVEQTPQKDINTEPRRGGQPNENFKDGPDGTQEPVNEGTLGGQGMGQGRGMNAGEGTRHQSGKHTP